SRYALEAINFTAGDRPYRVKGGGTFAISGEVAVTVVMSLELQIDDGFTNQVCYFTNSTSGLDRRWPMTDITVAQTNGKLAQVFTLRLAAAPVREIWFSTASYFKATAGVEASNVVEGGDLISTSRRMSSLSGSVSPSTAATCSPAVAPSCSPISNCLRVSTRSTPPRITASTHSIFGRARKSGSRRKTDSTTRFSAPFTPATCSAI